MFMHKVQVVSRVVHDPLIVLMVWILQHTPVCGLKAVTQEFFFFSLRSFTLKA